MVDLLLKLLYRLIGHATPKQTIIKTSRIDMYEPSLKFSIPKTSERIYWASPFEVTTSH